MYVRDAYWLFFLIEHGHKTNSCKVQMETKKSSVIYDPSVEYTPV